MTPARTTRTTLQALALVALGALLVLGTYRLAYRAGWNELHQSTQRRLQFLSADLASALDKYNILPLALTSHPDLLALLRHPGDATLRDSVNRQLERLARESHVAALYLVDAGATTVAASNWNTPRSFIGQNYAFRPYFRDAMSGGVGRFYAIGATTGEPGYFLAHRMRDDATAAGQPLGVVAVKISLDDIEANWARSGELLMLADAHGVVFLASRPEWKFRTLEPLAPATRESIRATQQYGDSALEPLAFEGERPAGDISAAARLAVQEAGGTRWLRVAGQRRALGHMDWTLLSFSETDELEHLARGYAAAAGFAYGFALVGWLYARLRKRRDQERRAARRELERANAELESRITERTAVLVQANEELEAKIAELDRTQSALRATQDELVQAGKLTVLGQMAASITHEINQPLAALRALNDNARILLGRGDMAAVQGNLTMVDGLTQRIASIIGELKGFARKDDLRQRPVAVAPVIEAAIALVSADARRAGVQIEAAGVPAGLAVHGQAVRIEQVLVNLLRNALDADRESGGRTIDIALAADEEWVRIGVADAGPGIAPEAMARLFEPFFTTKPTGQGLGLGLSISASIANALGGGLEATNRPEGGALFTLRLRRATLADHPQATASRTIG